MVEELSEEEKLKRFVEERKKKLETERAKGATVSSERKIMCGNCTGRLRNLLTLRKGEISTRR
jgi:hypothetical protein